MSSSIKYKSYRAGRTLRKKVKFLFPVSLRIGFFMSLIMCPSGSHGYTCVDTPKHTDCCLSPVLRVTSKKRKRQELRIEPLSQYGITVVWSSRAFSAKRARHTTDLSICLFVYCLSIYSSTKKIHTLAYTHTHTHFSAVPA